MLDAITIAQGLGSDKMEMPVARPIINSDTAGFAPELNPNTSGPANAFRKELVFVNPIECTSRVDTSERLSHSKLPDDISINFVGTSFAKQNSENIPNGT